MISTNCSHLKSGYWS